MMPTVQPATTTVVSGLDFYLAGGGLVSRSLKPAMKLDQALKARGSTNVFEVLRAEFVANALPVYGVLFERVATYAMQNY